MSDSTTPQDDKEMSPASAGSHWHITWRDAAMRLGERLEPVGPLGYYSMSAGGWLQWAAGVVLSRKPTLTDEEREAIEGIVSDFQEIAEFNEERCHPHYAEKARRRAAMLAGLLERLG